MTINIVGLWKLADIVNSRAQGGEFDVTVHFTDDRYIYSISYGEITRSKYRFDATTDPAHLDIGRSLGICRIENGRLFVARAMPANPRPAGFDGNSVTIYEYAGEGPVDWRSRYKQQMRQQLEQILKTDSENGILNTGQDSETGLWEHKTVQL